MFHNNFELKSKYVNNVSLIAKSTQEPLKDNGVILEEEMFYPYSSGLMQHRDEENTTPLRFKRSVGVMSNSNADLSSTMNSYPDET